MRRARGIRTGFRHAATADGKTISISNDHWYKLLSATTTQPNKREKIITAFFPNGCSTAPFIILKNHLNPCNVGIYTYGTAENKDIRTKIRPVATKVTLGSYTSLICTRGVFSLVAANPPVGGTNFIGTDQEVVAFSDLSLPGQYLYPGSIFICALSTNLLDKIATLASIRFTNIKVLRFSEQRAFFIGTKSASRVTGEIAQKQKDMLINYAKHPETIPPLDSLKEDSIFIKPTIRPPANFRSLNLDEEDFVQMANESKAWNKIKTILEQKSSVVKAPKPLLPLNVTHIAIAAAAGVINGQAGDHIRRGVIKESLDTMTVDEDDRRTQIEARRYISHVRIFSQKGVYDLDYAPTKSK